MNTEVIPPVTFAFALGSSLPVVELPSPKVSRMRSPIPAMISLLQRLFCLTSGEIKTNIYTSKHLHLAVLVLEITRTSSQGIPKAVIIYFKDSCGGPASGPPQFHLPTGKHHGPEPRGGPQGTSLTRAWTPVTNPIGATTMISSMFCPKGWFWMAFFALNA